jgi:hypothetical protein
MMPLIVAAIVIFATGVSALGRSAVRKLVSPQALKEAHETIGIFFGAVGLIYSLILAFALVGVWDDFEELHSTVRQEALALERAEQQAATVGAPAGAELARGLGSYRRLVRQEEWDRHPGRSNPASRTLLHRMQQAAELHTDTASRKSAWRGVAADLDRLEELRQDRLDHATAHMPPIVWLLLVAGSMLVIVMSWLFAYDSRRLHVFLASSLGVLVLLCLLALYRMDHPLLIYRDILLENYATLDTGHIRTG